MHDAPPPTLNLEAPSSSPALDLTTMDKHFNFTSFSPADLGAPVTAVLLCAHRDVRDGRPPKPRRPNDDDDYFYRYRGHHPLFDSDDEDFPMHAAEDGDADAPPPLMPNHWTMILELASTDGNNVPRGVKLDMAPGHQPTRPFREGTVLVSSLPLSSLATLEPIVKALRFLVPFATSITTVQHVLANIRDNARHRYVFSENGEGSRYWIREVVSDMVTADVLDDGAAARAESAMAVLWGDGGEEMAREKGLRKGLRRGMFTEWTIRGEKKKTWW